MSLFFAQAKFDLPFANRSPTSPSHSVQVRFCTYPSMPAEAIRMRMRRRETYLNRQTPSILRASRTIQRLALHGIGDAGLDEPLRTRCRCAGVVCRGGSVGHSVGIIEDFEVLHPLGRVIGFNDLFRALDEDAGNGRSSSLANGMAASWRRARTKSAKQLWTNAER